MNALIRVVDRQISAETTQAVSARDLHKFLGVASEFRHWIKNRIADFGFLQDVDFIAGKFLPGSDRVDYFITLDMAKELSMVERNERGKQARQYFIECERRAKAQAPQAPALPQDYLSALKALTAEVETRLALEHKVEEQSSKLEEQSSKLAEQAPKVAARRYRVLPLTTHTRRRPVITGCHPHGAVL